MSKINLQRGKLTVENRKSGEKKGICSEVSVNIKRSLSQTYLNLSQNFFIQRRNHFFNGMLNARLYSFHFDIVYR